MNKLCGESNYLNILAEAKFLGQIIFLSKVTRQFLGKYLYCEVSFQLIVISIIAAGL